MSLVNPNRSANSNSPRKAHRAWKSVAAAVERAMMVNGMNKALVPERIGAVYLFDEMSNPDRVHYHKAQLVVIVQDNADAQALHQKQLELSSLPKKENESSRRLSRWIRGGDPFIEFLSPEQAALKAAHDANIKITLLASDSKYIQDLVAAPTLLNYAEHDYTAIGMSAKEQAERSLFARVIAKGIEEDGKINLAKALDERTVKIKQTLKTYRSMLHTQSLRDFLGSGLADQPQLAVLRKQLGLYKKKIRREQNKWPQSMENMELLKRTSQLQALQDIMVISAALGNNGWEFCRSVFGEKMTNLMGKIVFKEMTDDKVLSTLSYVAPAVETPSNDPFANLVERFRDRLSVKDSVVKIVPPTPGRASL